MKVIQNAAALVDHISPVIWLSLNFLFDQEIFLMSFVIRSNFMLLSASAKRSKKKNVCSIKSLKQNPVFSLACMEIKLGKTFRSFLKYVDHANKRQERIFFCFSVLHQAVYLPPPCISQLNRSALIIWICFVRKVMHSLQKQIPNPSTIGRLSSNKQKWDKKNCLTATSYSKKKF